MLTSPAFSQGGLVAPVLASAWVLGFDLMVRDESIEVLFLHPLPFGGDVWAPIVEQLGATRIYAPTIYSLGNTLQEVAQAVLDLVEGKRLIERPDVLVSVLRDVIRSSKQTGCQ